MSDAHFDPLVHVAQDDHPDRVAEARAQAGRAIRDVGHALVGHHAPIELLDDVTRALDGLTRQLCEGAVRSRSEVRGLDFSSSVSTMARAASLSGMRLMRA